MPQFYSNPNALKTTPQKPNIPQRPTPVHIHPEWHNTLTGTYTFLKAISQSGLEVKDAKGEPTPNAFLLSRLLMELQLMMASLIPTGPQDNKQWDLTQLLEIAAELHALNRQIAQVPLHATVPPEAVQKADQLQAQLVQAIQLLTQQPV